MAGVSTGINLLTAGTPRLIDSMADFWDFTDSSLISYRGNSSDSGSNGASAIAGVDNAVNGGLSLNSDSSTNPVRVSVNAQLSFGSGGSTYTIVVFANSSQRYALYWGESGTVGGRANAIGYRPSENTIVKGNFDGTAFTTFTLPAFTPSLGAVTTYKFYAFTINTLISPSQNIKFFAGDGSVICDSTQNFAIFPFSKRIGIHEWVEGSFSFAVVDKLSVFNRELTDREIQFLYNSGNGRTSSEIESFY